MFVVGRENCVEQSWLWSLCTPWPMRAERSRAICSDAMRTRDDRTARLWRMQMQIVLLPRNRLPVSCAASSLYVACFFSKSRLRSQHDLHASITTIHRTVHCCSGVVKTLHDVGIARCTLISRTVFQQKLAWNKRHNPWRDGCRRNNGRLGYTWDPTAATRDPAP